MQEIITTPEFKRKVTKVIIECRRHGQKENDEKKDNRKKLLTPTGRKQAVDKGKEFHPQSRVSVAVGSPQERTQETAAHMMLADEEKISVNDTLEKMQASIAEELKVGEKIIEDERLDFGFDGPIGEEVNAEYKKNNLLKFLINQSDKLVVDKNDNISSSYLRFAGNFAEIYAKYCQKGDNFNRIASASNKYDKFGNQMERYLSTHNGAAESFIAKILEKTRGIEVRNQYIEAVGGNGYAETQGFHTEIINNGQNQTIEITYDVGDKTEKIQINRKLLENIISEREEFEQKIKQK